MVKEFPARITKWSEVQALIDDDLLTPAEMKMIAAAQEGRVAEIGDAVPAPNTEIVKIRAALLRYMMLGGCADYDIEAAGVQIYGAWIDGSLDLNFTKTKGPIALIHCLVPEQVQLLQANLAALSLIRTKLMGGLNAQGAKIAGGIFLEEAEIQGEFCLAAAEIGGQLDCEGAKIRNAGSNALNIQNASIAVSVLLNRADILGAVLLSGVEIDGPLTGAGAKLRNADGYALNANGARIAGNVVLRRIQAEGEVVFAGTKLGGQLSCVDGRLQNKEGRALNCQGARINQDVFLDGICTNGELSLASAEIGGQLSCLKASLTNETRTALNAQGVRIASSVFFNEMETNGQVNLMSSKIEGQLSCRKAEFRNQGGIALHLQRAQISNSFHWREVKRVVGSVDLNSAHVADLVDDPASWAKCERPVLAGFTYDILHGTTDVEERLSWLSRGSIWNGSFHPQPYEQLSKILRRSGHNVEARAVLVAKEKAQRNATRLHWRGERKLRRQFRWFSLGLVADGQKKLGRIFEETPSTTELVGVIMKRFDLFHGKAKDNAPKKYEHAKTTDLARNLAQQDFRNEQLFRALRLRFRIGLHWCWDKLLSFTVGYGYKPQRSAYVLGALILIGGTLSQLAWDGGDFAPNSDVILDSNDWQTLATARETYSNPAQTWSNQNERGQDYATFNAVYYAIDIVVPIISIGQEAAWAPSTNRGAWGWWLWLANPVLTLLGWIVTAIGAAAVTGVIRKD
ncbi:hypothetical protein [Loktanella sp. Alg231-35]|uniref:hypothetical protein n=1 Tax=Loktanella sp. Alg231-35 TaxID=1922220 RepID=UPI000D55A665|nr:hypothetical protein [Loktanella sp. Alg231-35]